MSDLRLALRRIRQTPVVSAAIVVLVGLGLGVTTAIFSLVNSLLFRPLPVADPDRLVTVSSNLALQYGLTTGLGWSHAIWLRMEERAGAFDGALAWVSGEMIVRSGSERRPVKGLFTSGSFFRTLGIEARAGRLYGLADDVPGGGPDGPVVVISDRFWQRQYARDPRVIGSPLAVGQGTATIVGVTPLDFTGIELGRAFDVAVPFGIEPYLRGDESAIGPNQFLLTFMLRLKPSQSAEAAEDVFHTIQPDLIRSMGVPRTVEEPVRLVPAGNGADRHRFRWSYQQPLVAIFVAAALAFLVACSNIANLVFARASARTHELAVALALGAPRWRLVRQLSSEGVVLAVAGWLVGLVVAWWAIHAMAVFLAGPWAIDADLGIDWRVLGFGSWVAGMAMLVFSAAPAVLAFRSAPIEVLKTSDRRVGGARFRTAGLFVTAQVALSTILVVVTGLFVGTVSQLARQPLGFLSDRILIVDVHTNQPLSATDRIDLHERLVRSAANIRDVAAAAGSRLTPLSGASNSLYAEQKNVDLQNAVTPGWFATYGMPVQSGRDFDGRDRHDAQPVAIVNDAYRRKHFPDRNPLGEVVGKRTIVGVVGDAVFSTVRAGVRPTIYQPLAQSANEPRDKRTILSVSIRPSSGAPVEVARVVTSALAGLSPGSTLSVRPLSDDVAASIAQERLMAMLSGLFAGLALALAGLGLYGLMSHVVARRTAELGIRMALGASSSQVVWLILERAIWLILLGVALGAVGAAWVSGIVASLLYGLGSRDATTFVGATVLLVVFGTLAAWLPARRAAKTNPADTLRSF